MRRLRSRCVLAAACGALYGSTAFGATTASWLAPTDASWTAPAAWSINPTYPDNAQPSPADLYNAIIAASGAPYTVALGSDITISSLLLNSTDATLAQFGGTLRLVDGGASINAGTYALSDGTLSSDDAITIGSRLVWTGGTLSGLGTVDIAPTGSLAVNPGVTPRTLSRQINNAGSMNFAAGSITLNNGTINNQAGATLVLGDNTTFTIGAGTSNLIRNSGVILVGSVLFSGPLLNTGTITATSIAGQLRFGAGKVTHGIGAVINGSGSIELGSTGSIHDVIGNLTLGGSNMALSAGVLTGIGTIDLTGKLTWNGGTFTGDGAFNILPGGTLDLANGGTHFFARPVNNSGGVTINFGSMVGTATLTNLPTGVINLKQGTLSPNTGGEILNNGVINVGSNSSTATLSVTANSGTININSGTCFLSGSLLDGSVLAGLGTAEFRGNVSGNVNASVAYLNIPNGGSLSNNGAFNLNASTMTMVGISSLSGGGVINIGPLARLGVTNFGTIATTINNSGLIEGLLVLNGGTVNNLSTGVMNIKQTSVSPTSMIRNSGTINVDFGTLSGASSTFSTQMVNSGTIAAISSGTFANISTLGFNTGSFVQANGAVLKANFPAYLNLASSSQTTQTFTGAVTVVGNNVVQSNGFVIGPGDMNIGRTAEPGSYNLGSGTLAGPGKVTVASNSFFFCGAGTLTRSVNNAGTMELYSGSLQFGSVSGSATIINTISNSGTMLFDNGTISSGSLVLNNAQLFNLSGATITASRTPWTFTGSGTSLVSNEGVINLNSGSFTFVNLSGPMTNAGTINTQAGTVLLGGTITHNTGAYLGGNATIDLSNNNIVNGTATFAGTKMRIGTGSMAVNGFANMTGSLTWSGGGLTGTGIFNVAPGATLTFTGSTPVTGATLRNTGVTNFSGGAPAYTGSSAGSFVNDTGGVLNFNSPNGLIASMLIIVNNGTININSSPAGQVGLGSTLINAGTINVQTGTLVLLGTTTFNAGAYLTGPATIDLTTTSSTSTFVGGTLTLAGGNVRLGEIGNSGTLIGPGNIDLLGTLTFEGGQIFGAGSLSIAPAGRLILANDFGLNRVLSRSLDNSGTMDFAAGSFNFSGGTINNLAGGVMNIASIAINGGTPSLIRNQGLINVNSAGSTNFTVPVLNSGSINVAAGSLLFGAGTFTHQNGTISTTGGSVELGASSLSTHITNGTLTLAGNINLSNGTISGPGSIKVTNTFNWNGGLITAGTFDSSSTLDVAPGATLNVATHAFGQNLFRALNNSGVMNMNGSITFGGNITNLAGATLNVAVSNPFDLNTGSVAAVSNFGQINVNPVSAQLVTFDMPMINAGTISVAQGTLTFSNQTFTYNSGSNLRGPGVINLGNAFAHQVNGLLTLAGSDMRLSGGGGFTGPGDIALTGTLSWQGGGIVGPGALNILPGGLLNAGGGMLSRAINNAGTLTLVSGGLQFSNGTINNQSTGVFNVTNAGIASSAGVNRITNAGTMNVLNGASIAAPFNFSNSGTLIVNGEATFTGGVSQVVGPTLLAGNWIVRGTGQLGITGTPITNSAANVVLDGPDSHFAAINSLAVNSGTLQLQNGRNFGTAGNYTNSGRTIVGVSSALDIHGNLTNTGTIDVGGVVVVDYAGASPIESIRAQVTSGFAAGSWDGIGIDSTPAADNLNPHKTAVGYAEASAVGITGSGTFASQSVDETSTLIRYTLVGDANLDTVVNALDFNAFATHFGMSSPFWTDADFNYDGVVNSLDFAAIAGNFGYALPGGGAASVFRNNRPGARQHCVAELRLSNTSPRQNAEIATTDKHS